MLHGLDRFLRRRSPKQGDLGWPAAIPGLSGAALTGMGDVSYRDTDAWRGILCDSDSDSESLRRMRPPIVVWPGVRGEYAICFLASARPVREAPFSQRHHCRCRQHEHPLLIRYLRCPITVNVASL